MTYSDGSETPGQYGAFTALDIVGHEASHGVVEASGGLIYKGESGALNESILNLKQVAKSCPKMSNVVPN